MQDPEIDVPQEVLEGRRKDLELFYFLRRQGVYGALDQGFPTAVAAQRSYVCLAAHDVGARKGPGDDFPPMRSIRFWANSDRLWIKGLDPERSYLIESRLGSMAPQTKTGAEWMREGIWLDDVHAGEVLFINLPDRPGTGSIRELPEAPRALHVAPAQWLNRRGVGVSWTAPDNHDLISYYELVKDGAL